MMVSTKLPRLALRPFSQKSPKTAKRDTAAALRLVVLVPVQLEKAAKCPIFPETLGQ